MKYDLLIKGGTVVDPSQDVNDLRDVGFVDGKVAALGRGLSEGDAAEVVDASGLIVVPGLIDLHVHVFPGVSHFGVEPDSTSLAKGVTTAVDAGSSGAGTFRAFRKYILEPSETRLYALLNISAMGMIIESVGELEDLRWADVESAVSMVRENRDYIVGIKARLSRETAGEQDVDALKRALEAAEAAGGFIMVHVGNTRTPLEDLVAMLRPGDVVTHSFHGREHGILDDVGKVLGGVRDAQRRGVVFDIGHGAGSFAFDTAEKALADGFSPDNISSDLHSHNVGGPVFEHLLVLSKFLHLGMPLDEVIGLSTSSAAKVISKGDILGTLKVGSVGDAAVLSIDEGSYTLTDAMGVSVQGRRKLSHVATIKGGQLYCPRIG